MNDPKPCPVCEGIPAIEVYHGDVNDTMRALLNDRVDEYMRRDGQSRATCRCGQCGPWKDITLAAITAWNALYSVERVVEVDGGFDCLMGDVKVL